MSPPSIQHPAQPSLTGDAACWQTHPRGSSAGQVVSSATVGDRSPRQFPVSPPDWSRIPRGHKPGISTSTNLFFLSPHTPRPKVMLVFTSGLGLLLSSLHSSSLGFSPVSLFGFLRATIVATQLITSLASSPWFPHHGSFLPLLSFLPQCPWPQTRSLPWDTPGE